MPVGFQAFTDTGLYQIDGKTPNYQMVQAMSGQSVIGTLRLAYNDAGKPFTTTLPNVTLTFRANAGPMYGVYASGGIGISLWSAKRSDSTYTLTFITEQPCTVYLFLFDRVPPASGNFGLQVFDASGSLIADASRPFLRVLDVIFEDYMNGVGWTVEGAPSPPWHSRSYGVPVLISAIYSVHRAWSYDPGVVELSSIRVDGGNVSWGTALYNGGRTPNIACFREQYHSRFMVLDATGLV
ncbi:hypothetical protein GNZ25_05420 [Burkholderia thailandensis]|uniref:hypothetical protein n=1 Tax=Burkholderia thailandensis TaxID=57975 RepID=UPI0012E814EF|nr:hypothetical protein [Burkholderia thailandensis]MUV20846.1 hypothetical protein [Burkholderia thailandensis]